MDRPNKHQAGTPLPLKFLPAEGNFIVNAREEIVAEVPCQGVENDKQVGAYVAHAANAYPALVEALRKINQTIYAKGAALGSSAYFDIRTAATETLIKLGEM